MFAASHVIIWPKWTSIDLLCEMLPLACLAHGLSRSRTTSAFNDEITPRSAESTAFLVIFSVSFTLEPNGLHVPLGRHTGARI